MSLKSVCFFMFHNIMDYKFVILLVILLVILFYYFRENEETKNLISTGFENMNTTLKHDIKEMRNKIQSDMITCTNKIKNHNLDCIAQAKKINFLNGQSVTKMSNYFTESDTSAKNVIPYLSDMNEKSRFKSEQKDNSCYYSSDTKRKYASENFDIVVNDTHAKQLNKTSSEISESRKTNELIDNAIKEINDEIKELEEDSFDSPNDSESLDTNLSTEQSKKSNNSNNSSFQGTITIGNENEGKVPNIKTSNHKDLESVNTVDILGLKKNNFMSIDDYTKKDLDQIAKTHSIPTTYKDDSGKRLTYKKEELYELIKENLD